MAEACAGKLVVEVCNAKNLMPKDGQGTASAYAIVDFDGQRRRTKTKFRDLNPQWDEALEFSIHDGESLAAEVLEVNLYNDKKTGKKGTFLGKVKIAGSCFAKSGAETLVYYPLEKRSVFSQIKGEIGLKVYCVDVDPPAAATEEQKVPDAAGEKLLAEGETKLTEEAKGEHAVEDKKEEEKPKAEEKKEEEKLIPPEEEAKPEEAPAKLPAEVDEDPVPPPPKSAESKMGADKSKVSMSDLDLRSLSSDRVRGSYDLVDRMAFLFVRVVKSKRGDEASKLPAYAKLMIGTHAVKTRTCIDDKEWDQVFAFDKDGLNSTNLEVSVWVEEKKENEEAAVKKCLGSVSFDLLEIPKRVPPDSPLAPQWYTLESETSPGTDVMLAAWLGSQADEAFQEAWQSDSGGMIPETRAKVYLAPKLWYLRLTVIQTQDLQLGSVPEPKVKSCSPRPELYVKAQLGPQLFKTTRTSGGSTSSGSANPTWNEDLVFVAAEPFEPFFVITVEEAKTANLIGQAKVHVPSIEKRIDSSSEPPSKWFNLVGDEGKPYAGRIHVRVCLEGGYHVLDEAAHVTSDVRASAKQLATPPIGLLEVGIRGATNLLPVKTKDGMRGTADAYVVAKYGPKWVRTRTILDRFNPRWNEQYVWDVYDPCTVLTIGVFDNGRYKHDESGKPGKDMRIGKLRVRLSTLDTNRVYVNSYSLVALYPGGAKKMGEIEIAVRFASSSWLSLIQAYSSPLLPKMHYVRPLGPAQQEILSHTAMRIVTARLERSEPPLGQEVVQFMLDSDSHIWSIRRSKANWFRIVGCLSRTGSVLRFLDGIRTWAHPPTTVLAHVVWATAVLCPHLVLPTMFMYAFLVLVLRFRYRGGGNQSGIDPRLSCADTACPDELDEEFDGFPTARTPDAVRIRYDRLRALAGRAQAVMGDVAAQGERLESLLNWRDPRATGIFVVFCFMASLMFYAVPFKVVVMAAGFYFLRHPRFRHDMPSVPVNFFRRLPSLSDQIM